MTTTLHTRSLSFSTSKHAQEDNTPLSEALAKSFDVSKITENPGILEALGSLVQVAREEGRFSFSNMVERTESL